MHNVYVMNENYCYFIIIYYYYCLILYFFAGVKRHKQLWIWHYMK